MKNRSLAIIPRPVIVIVLIVVVVWSIFFQPRQKAFETLYPIEIQGVIETHRQNRATLIVDLNDGQEIILGRPENLQYHPTQMIYYLEEGDSLVKKPCSKTLVLIKKESRSRYLFDLSFDPKRDVRPACNQNQVTLGN